MTEFKRQKNRTGPAPVLAKAFADLYRGGPDHCRGHAGKCYKEIHPRVKESTANSSGSRWLNDPLVQQYLEDAAERSAIRADVTQEMVLDELRKLAFFDVRKLYHNDGTPKAIGELDDDTAAAIIGLDAVNIGNSESGIGSVLKYKLADKKGALELFGKNLKMWTDKVEASVTGGKSLAELAQEARDESE